MIPVLTICFIAFIIVINVTIRKKNANQSELDEQFWERERKANSTLKKDISNLDYTTIPEDFFLCNLQTETEDNLRDLLGKTLLNLNGMTNTDVKLAYGVNNFQKLAEYDENFSKFVQYVPDYALELEKAGHNHKALEILKFADEKGADSNRIRQLIEKLSD